MVILEGLFLPWTGLSELIWFMLLKQEVRRRGRISVRSRKGRDGGELLKGTVATTAEKMNKKEIREKKR